MSEHFTADELRRLAPFFTDLDAPIFGLNLPQEVAGALFSRYSRSTRSLRRIFLLEFLDHCEVPDGGRDAANPDAALQKARAFYDRVLVGYGDDSVAQLGGAHLACEGVSNVVAKLIEDARIGIAPLEKSSRYVRFDQRDAAGDYPIYPEPTLLASRHRDAYLSVMNLLFETYSRQIDPMIAWMEKASPITEVTLKHPQTGEPLTYDAIRGDAVLLKQAQVAYRATIRAAACDALRAYLPAATRTNVGLFGSGQAFEYLLTKLYSHPLAEARQVAAAAHLALNALIPSFVKRAGFSPYLAQGHEADQALAAEIARAMPVDDSPPVTLVDYDSHAEEKIIAALLYSHARQPLTQLRARVARMTADERGAILKEVFSRRQNRREKPGRAFEQVYYTFDLLGNLGLYRDLHRHRLLTQERQDFTTDHGYDTPPAIEAMGFATAFHNCMAKAAVLYTQIRADLPHAAQYVVPFAYRIRWYMKMNLREAVHIGELRTTPQGHADYRRIVQEMWRKIGEVHPGLADCAKFIDWKEYDLGRLQSEMRTEHKKTIVSMYGGGMYGGMGYGG